MVYYSVIMGWDEWGGGHPVPSTAQTCSSLTYVHWTRVSNTHLSIFEFVIVVCFCNGLTI